MMKGKQEPKGRKMIASKPPTVYDDETKTELIEWQYVAELALNKLSLSDDLKSSLWRYRKRTEEDREYWIWDEVSKFPIVSEVEYWEEWRFDEWESEIIKQGGKKPEFKKLQEDSFNYEIVTKIERLLRQIMALPTWIVYRCNPSEKAKSTSCRLEDLYHFNQVFWQFGLSDSANKWPVSEKPHYLKPERPNLVPGTTGSEFTDYSNGDCLLFLPWKETKEIIDDIPNIKPEEPRNISQEVQKRFMVTLPLIVEERDNESIISVLAKKGIPINKSDISVYRWGVKTVKAELLSKKTDEQIRSTLREESYGPKNPVLEHHFSDIKKALVRKSE